MNRANTERGREKRVIKDPPAHPTKFTRDEIRASIEAVKTQTEQDLTTREFCQRCQRVSPVGFFSPRETWLAVAGRHWSNDILCILCFAQLGDEKHIAWEEGIEFHPVSYATHHARRGRG